MKLAKYKTKCLVECAKGVIEFERSDWENQLYQGELVDNHLYTLAVIGIYGLHVYTAQLKGELKRIEKMSPLYEAMESLKKSYQKKQVSK